MATITGTNQEDFLAGTADGDQISGLGQDDILRGLAGNDFLSGGNGNDVLAGGPGNDFLSGGKGEDQFFFAPTVQDQRQRDVVSDFEEGIDLINLRAFDVSFDDLVIDGNRVVIPGTGQVIVFQGGYSPVESDFLF